MKWIYGAWGVIGALLVVMNIFGIGVSTGLAADPAVSGSPAEPVVYLLGRDECGFCQAEKEWLDAEGVPYVYLNIVEDEYAAQLFAQVTEKHGLTKVTPINVVGERVILGFNGPNTTGVQI